METIEIKKLFPKKTEEVIEKLAFFANSCYYYEEFKNTSKRQKKKLMREIFVLAKMNHCWVKWLGDNKVCCLPDQWIVAKRGREYKIVADTLRNDKTPWAYVTFGGKRK